MVAVAVDGPMREHDVRFFVVDQLPEGFVLRRRNLGLAIELSGQ